MPPHSPLCGKFSSTISHFSLCHFFSRQFKRTSQSVWSKFVLFWDTKCRQRCVYLDKRMTVREEFCNTGCSCFLVLQRAGCCYFFGLGDSLHDTSRSFDRSIFCNRSSRYLKRLRKRPPQRIKLEPPGTSSTVTTGHRGGDPQHSNNQQQMSRCRKARWESRKRLG